MAKENAAALDDMSTLGLSDEELAVLNGEDEELTPEEAEAKERELLGIQPEDDAVPDEAGPHEHRCSRGPARF